MALTDKLTAIADAIRAQSGKTAKIPLSQMPTEIINLQSLNFELVGNPKPENPKENTIWINTDVEIPGWEFGTTAPIVQDGNVWVKTGKASLCAFNAMTKNCVTVYPLCVLQCDSGEWKYMEAEIYQGGWIELLPEVAFFANGILNTDTFGSLTIVDNGQNFSISNGIIIFNSYVRVKTTELFDVTAFNTIELEVYNFAYTYIGMELWDEAGNSYALVESGEWVTGGTKTYDISEYTGKYYLKIVASGKASDSTQVSSIKFKA